MPRLQEVNEPEQALCGCSAERHVIGEDTTERPDILPAQFRVLVTRRPKYADRSRTNGVGQAPAPARFMPGGMPTEATVARTCADPLPRYRPAQIYNRRIGWQSGLGGAARV